MLERILEIAQPVFATFGALAFLIALGAGAGLLIVKATSREWPRRR